MPSSTTARSTVDAASASLVIMVCLIAGVAAGDAPPRPDGAARDHAFYLSTDTGPAGPQAEAVPLMRDHPGHTAADDIVIPILGDATAAADLPPLHHASSIRTWYADHPFRHDHLAHGVAVVQLWFDTELHIDAWLVITLGAMETDDTARTLATTTHALAQVPEPDRQLTLEVDVDGARLDAGTRLTLTVAIQGPSVLHWLRYGGPEAPSGIHQLTLTPLALHGEGSEPGEPTRARDTDDDGLANDVEAFIGTDPFRADTDGDGAIDGVEHHHGTDPLDLHDAPPDADRDGLPDSFETAHGLDPTKADSNGNGVLDGEGDPDADELVNRREAAHGTHPWKPDTDGDGHSDGSEVGRGWDPLVPQTTPATVGVKEVVAASTLSATVAAIGVYGFRRRG